MTQTDPIHELLVRMELALRSGHRVMVVGQLGSVPVVEPQPFPLAPLTAQGWDMESYLANWTGQVSYLIDQHGGTGQKCPIVRERTNRSARESKCLRHFRLAPVGTQSSLC